MLKYHMQASLFSEIIFILGTQGTRLDGNQLDENLILQPVYLFSHSLSVRKENREISI